MNRRHFLQALSAGAAVALARPGDRPHRFERGYICEDCGASMQAVEDNLVPLACEGYRRIFLPPRPRVDLKRYLTSNQVWYLRTDEDIPKFHREPLSEASLERMLVAIKREADAFGIPLTFKPTHIIIRR